jgi:hypothetical protein
LEALACFEAARDLRLALPIESVPAFRYGLAACWLNRGDALMRIGDAGRRVDALRSYDEGLDVLGGLVLADDPRFSRRMAIAHQNRGLILLAQDPPVVGEAVASFTRALAVLDDECAAAIDDRQYLQAATWVNLANARALGRDAESSTAAREAAIRALALVAETEREQPESADIGLQARHVICHLVARRLSAPIADAAAMTDAVHEATDTADDGLSLAGGWERKGVTRFRPLACDLFRFGARVYAIYQPHFLDEFLADHMDPDRSSADFVNSDEIRSAADEARALADSLT